MRNIPAGLKAHLEQPVTTVCRLLKIKLKDGQEFGVTNLDQDLVYQGTTYHAMNGFDPSVIASDSSFGVDNAEGFALISAEVPGITAEMVKRGELDDGTWEMLLVNYRNLSQGAALLDAGDLGEVRLTQDDQVYIPELLSYAMRLRQAIGHVDSRKCRAIFGSDPLGQRGCGVDAEALWVSGTVDSMDDPFYTFRDSSLNISSDFLPGRMQWLTGDNASQRLYALESVGNTIMVFERFPFQVQVGDTFRIRPDCDKRFETCRDRWGNMLNFKGEPLIPVSDGTAAQTPGATV